MLWTSTSFGARLIRGALLPASALFRAATTVRDALYSAGVLRAHELGAPAISVGNLTVGGTGKTPFASWLAEQFIARGAHPAILLRGYGGDEVAVHGRLSPSTIVVANSDRVAGAKAARDRGADVLVLDDAFQHRRVARNIDVVLISADSVGAAQWPLPSGPWREPVTAVRRARLVVVTAKAASDADVRRTIDAVRAASPNTQTSVVRFDSGALVQWGSFAQKQLSEVRDRRALAVSAIGDPAAFVAQLRAAGLTVESVAERDHYLFTAADAARLSEKARRNDLTICTLKDAVKLGPLWPPDAPPLWYLSQRLRVERGAEILAGLVAELLAARRA